MLKLIIHYVLTAIVFFAIDILWLGLIAKKFYGRNLGHLLSPDVNWIAAVIFYLMFIGGIMIFAVYPNMEKGMNSVLLYGALFGLITYATYDLTNLATLKNWPVNVVVVDMIWGTVLTAIVSISSAYILKFLN
jgi:uncharacterized membrane protein